MLNANKSLRVCKNNILKCSLTNRTILLYILLFVLVYIYSKDLASFTINMPYNIMPCTFPFFLNSRICKYLIMIGIIVLFFDAPFISNNEKYVVIRSGKKNWAIGNVLYIMCETAIYFSVLTLFSIIVLIPNIYFSNSWGKLMNTVALNPMKSLPLYIDYVILETYTPMKAYLISFFLNWCAGTLIGLIMLLVNMHSKQYIGVIVALVIISIDVLFDPTAILTAPNKYMYMSPLTLTNLRILDQNDLGLTPSFTMILIYFSGLISILSRLVIWRAPKVDIYN